MSVIILDPRFPAMVPLDAVELLRHDVCYTDEVPVRVRWIVAGFGGHVVDETEVLVTTDPSAYAVRSRLAAGDHFIVSPTLAFHVLTDDELEASHHRARVFEDPSLPVMEVRQIDFPSSPNPSSALDGGTASAASGDGALVDGSLPALPAPGDDGAKSSADGADAGDNTAGYGSTNAGGSNGDTTNAGVTANAGGSDGGESSADNANAGDSAADGTNAGDNTADASSSSETAGAEELTGPSDTPANLGVTALGIPVAVLNDLEQAIAVMARAVRQGPWERKQTHASLVPFLEEETAELREAIFAWRDADVDSRQAADEHLCNELSDVLLQVLFHAQIANTRGAFDIGHVAAAFVKKMRSRAPYLFEEVEREISLEEQERLWGEGKAKEKGE